MTSTTTSTFAAACALALPLACNAGEEATTLMAAYSARVVHIETIGVLHDTSLQDDVGSGSGLLIGSRHVLSVNHNVPRESAYKSLTVSIRVGSPQADPLAVESYERDPARDLVLITLKEPVPFDTRSCPMPVIKDASLAPLGTNLLAMGYPLDLRRFSINPGMLKAYAGPKDSYWVTNAMITYGDSGGPVFAYNGALIGLAAGGVYEWDLGGEKRPVAGVNFLVPATDLRASPLMAKIEQIPQPERCWRTVPDGQAVALSNEALVGSLPELVQRSLTIAVTKDDHHLWWSTRPYEHRITADPGYTITQCTWRAASANKVANERCVIDEKGENAVFTFELTSGPFLDRTRGWWGGLMLVDQRRKM